MRQQQTFDRVLALPGPVEQELRAAANDRDAVADELFQQLLERQRPRLAVDQRQEDQREGVLQRRELVELVEHDLGVGVALDLQDQPHRLFQIALVADRRDAFDLVVVDQIGDAFFDAVAGLLVGNFVDDDPLAVLAEVLDPAARADDDVAAAGVIALANPGPAADDAAGGKVGPRHDLHQLVDGDVGLVDDA